MDKDLEMLNDIEDGDFGMGSLSDEVRIGYLMCSEEGWFFYPQKEGELPLESEVWLLILTDDSQGADGIQ